MFRFIFIQSFVFLIKKRFFVEFIHQNNDETKINISIASPWEKLIFN